MNLSAEQNRRWQAWTIDGASELCTEASVNDERRGEGRVVVRPLLKRERTKRATMILILWWMLAAFAVLIPALHFVLVPAFLVLGPVLAWRALNQGSAVVGGFSTCPNCHGVFEVASGASKWPRIEICPTCGHSVKLKPVLMD